jgi:RING finger protein 113A
MSDTASTTAPNVPFFKKRNQSKNVRKRNLSDDESTPPSSTSASEPSNPNHSALSSISKKRSAKRAPQTSNSDILLSSSTSSANRLTSKHDDNDDKTVGVAYKATLEGNVRIDDATRTQEIDTAHDRDTQAIIDRHMRSVENGLDDVADDGLYKGLSGYKSHIKKGEVTNSKIRYAVASPSGLLDKLRITHLLPLSAY